VPVAVALGHATDQLVLDRVADYSFPTPTAAGAWMKTTIDQKRAHHREKEEAQAIGEAKTFKEQLQRLEQTNSALVQNAEREAQARRETEARFLAQQQALLNQLATSRAQAEEALRRAREAEAAAARLTQTAAGVQVAKVMPPGEAGHLQSRLAEM